MLKLWVIELLTEEEEEEEEEERKIFTDPEHSCLQQLCKERN